MLLVKDRSLLYELKAYLVYVKMREFAVLEGNWRDRKRSCWVYSFLQESQYLIHKVVLFWNPMECIHNISELQIRGAVEDNAKIYFSIKTYVVTPH